MEIDDGEDETQKKKDAKPLLTMKKKIKLKPLPSVPTLPKEVQQQFIDSSDTNSEYPPILQAHSWTRAVPFKDEYSDMTPSEKIGIHYCPKGARFRLKELSIVPKKKKKVEVHVDLKGMKAPPPSVKKNQRSINGIPTSCAIMTLEVRILVHMVFKDSGFTN